MLTTKKSITLQGYSVIDGVNVVFHQATINSENPSEIEIISSQLNKAAYKANRTLCRQDEANFEDMAYTMQDALIAEKEAATETTTATE